MDYAISMARKRGRMIAICHLRPETVAFLEGVSVESIEDEGVRLVTLPQLIEVEESRDE